MKTNHNSDPLDQQIDTLLASRPIKPNDDFAARVLAATETAVAEDFSDKTKRPLGLLIKFALPLAAAIAAASAAPRAVDAPPQGARRGRGINGAARRRTQWTPTSPLAMATR